MRRTPLVLLLAAVAITGCMPGSGTAPAPRNAPLRLSRPIESLAAHRVVPLPESVTPAAGAPFAFSAATTIVVDGSDEVEHTADLMGATFRKATGFRLPITRSGGTARNAILVRIVANPALGDEGYDLDISGDSIRLVAARPAGIFRGTQTIRQLLPVGIEAEQSAQRMATAWTIPPGHITDHPRFAWRGAMLDVARHFFSSADVKDFIDILALYKLNTLHLHLADDQGWRLQIDSWPKLTEVGGRTEVGGGTGGFYTKVDYASIVQYAAERYITIVPEIDMPGHTNAAIASYPELGCSRPTPGIYGGTQPLGTYTGIGVGWSTLCSDSATTLRFVDDVVREIAALTPGPYLHVGGDEVEVLTPAQYAGFVEHAQDIVYKYGKTMVGWEEVGKARLRPTSIAQLWRSDTALLALKQGAKLILSPGARTYLDMKYAPGTELGLRWAGFIELRSSYEWDPARYSAGLSEASVLGVEAPLWSETAKNITAVEYLVMPRLPAIAEVGWSGQGARDWESFRLRIAAHAPRWRLLGVNFYPSPQVDWDAW